MYHLWNRIAKLERYWEEAEAEEETEAEQDPSPAWYRVYFEGEQPAFPPGTRVFHLTPVGQGWVGVVGEDGVERRERWG